MHPAFQEHKKAVQVLTSIINTAFKSALERNNGIYT